MSAEARGDDREGYRAEFQALVAAASRLPARVAEK
jgi:hypothetical protein